MSHSIPDSQAVADIWAAVKNRSLPVKALTKAEYDVLDETQKNADVVYVVQKPGDPTPTPSGQSISIPVGLICIWSGSEVPNGWTLCDGTNGTPDLRGRFVLGESDSHPSGEIGGEEEVTLTSGQMPLHTHTLRYAASSGNQPTAETVLELPSGEIKAISTKNRFNMYVLNQAGSSEPHSNMPPYYVLAYIMYVGGEV